MASGENREDLKLPFLNNGRDAGINGVNRKGTIFVGRAHDGANDNRVTAVQWSRGKIISRPLLNNGEFSSIFRISSDGILTGCAADGANNNKITAVQWMKGEIMPLPFLNNGESDMASNISRDGAIIVGKAQDGTNNNRVTAVQWIKGEIAPLPFLNDGTFASAESVSNDGSTIVGFSEDGAKHNRKTAVHWINGKVFSTQDLLQSHGVDLQGYHLEFVNFVSVNGLQVRGKCYQELEHQIFLQRSCLPSIREAILQHSAYSRGNFKSVIMNKSPFPRGDPFTLMGSCDFNVLNYFSHFIGIH